MVYIYKELTDIDNISGYKSNKHYIDDNFKSYGKGNDKYGWERNNKNQGTACCFTLNSKLCLSFSP